jgi:hypothetical protein
MLKNLARESGFLNGGSRALKPASRDRQIAGQAIEGVEKPH